MFRVRRPSNPHRPLSTAGTHEDQRHSTGVDWTAKKCLLSTDGNLVCHVCTGKRKGRCNDDDIEEFLAQLGPACKHRLENLAVTCPVSAKLRQWLLARGQAAARMDLAALTLVTPASTRLAG